MENLLKYIQYKSETITRKLFDVLRTMKSLRTLQRRMHQYDDHLIRIRLLKKIISYNI